MESCTIEVFPAAHGDSFLIRRQSTAGIINVLIDGGFARTYRSTLRARLRELSSAGEVLSLLVVTHIDADHIGGILDFLRENGPSNAPQIIGVEEIWHNSYRHLHNSVASVAATADALSILREIEAQGFPSDVRRRGHDVEHPVSARQGSSLAALINKGGYAWNTAFDCKAVCCENPKIAFVRGDLSLTLLGPSRAKLDSLSSYWRKSLSSRGFPTTANAPFDDAFEFLVSREVTARVDFEKKVSASAARVDDLLRAPFVEDTSNTNGSSIAFILEVAGRRMLFLGDAHPSLVEHQLCVLSPSSPLHFDLVKIAHHGSAANTSPSLLTRLSSSRFILSTNGERFKHPDLETVLRIAALPSPKQLLFNYPTKAAEFLRNPDLTKRFEYSLHVGDGASIVRIDLSGQP